MQAVFAVGLGKSEQKDDIHHSVQNEDKLQMHLHCFLVKTLA
jgi:hypothetical protein